MIYPFWYVFQTISPSALFDTSQWARSMRRILNDAGRVLVRIRNAFWRARGPLISDTDQFLCYRQQGWRRWPCCIIRLSSPDNGPSRAKHLKVLDRNRKVRRYKGCSDQGSWTSVSLRLVIWSAIYFNISLFSCSLSLPADISSTLNSLAVLLSQYSSSSKSIPALIW